MPDLLTHMSMTDARQVLKSLSMKTPIVSAQHYFKVIAAMIVVYDTEMRRSNGESTVKEILMNAATFENYQYLQNNARYLKRTEDPTDIPTGTTGNEAFHRGLSP